MLEDEVKNTIMLFDQYVHTNIHKIEGRKLEFESNLSDNKTAAVSLHSLVPNVP